MGTQEKVPLLPGSMSSTDRSKAVVLVLFDFVCGARLRCELSGSAIASLGERRAGRFAGGLLYVHIFVVSQFFSSSCTSGDWRRCLIVALPEDICVYISFIWFYVFFVIFQLYYIAGAH